MSVNAKTQPAPAISPGERVTSVDFFRGITMFLYRQDPHKLKF